MANPYRQTKAKSEQLGSKTSSSQSGCAVTHASALFFCLIRLPNEQNRNGTIEQPFKQSFRKSGL
jgi:hypothetical protein